MRRKTILLDLRLADPFTGIGIVTNKFLEFIQEGDYELHVIYNDNTADEKIVSDPRNLKLNSIYRIADHLRLYSYLRKNPPDYLIFPHYFVGLFIPEGIKTISFVHDIMAVSGWRTFWDNFAFIKAAILKSYLGICLKNVDILVPSYTVKKELRNILGFDSVVVPNGIANGIENKSGTSHKKSDYIYVGNTRRHKNVDFLLNVFKRRKETLKVVSKGQLGSDANIEVYQNIDEGKLQQLLSDSKALLLPSMTEGFCLPVIEAMALNTKVYANRTSIFKEFYGLEISYFKTSDSEELNFLIDNINTLSNSKVFTNFYKSEDLFNWNELRYFIQNLR